MNKKSGMIATAHTVSGRVIVRENQTMTNNIYEQSLSEVCNRDTADCEGHSESEWAERNIYFAKLRANDPMVYPMKGKANEPTTANS